MWIHVEAWLALNPINLKVSELATWLGEVMWGVRSVSKTAWSSLWVPWSPLAVSHGLSFPRLRLTYLHMKLP